MSEIINATPEVSAEVVPPYTAVADLIEKEPSFLEAVREYYEMQRADYVKRIAGIEDLLGFLRGTDELGARVAKLESFCGIKPA